MGGYSTPSFADLDGDGDLDAVVGEFGGTLRYFENTGSAIAPAFTARTGAANPFDTVDVGDFSKPSFADLDGDGDLDAVVGSGTLRYFENTGSATAPAFTARTGVANPFDGVDVGTASAPSFADLDGDGDLDAVIGEQDGNLNYFRNTGAGFTLVVDVTAQNDAAALSADVRNLTETNAAADISSSGTLTISDVDSPTTFVAQAGTVGLYGTFAINTAGAWTYTASSAHDEFAAGTTYTDTFPVAGSDGTLTSVTINIAGSNDAATLSADVRDLTEANTAAAISSSGTLTITDPDNAASFVAQAGTAGLYGTFAIDTAGAWTYAASSAHNEFAAGTTYTDTFSVAEFRRHAHLGHRQHRRQQRHTGGQCAEPRHRQGHRRSGDAVGLGRGRRQPRLRGAERPRAWHAVRQRCEPHLYARSRLPRAGFLQLCGQRRHAGQRGGERQPERAPEHCAGRHCVRPVGRARAGLQCVGPVLGE